MNKFNKFNKSGFSAIGSLLLAGFVMSPTSQADIVAIDSVTIDGSNQLLTATVGGTAYGGGTVATASLSSSNVEGSMGVSFDGTDMLTAGTAAPSGDTLDTTNTVAINIDGDILTGSAGGSAAGNTTQSGGALNLQWGSGLGFTDNDADPDFFIFEDLGNDDVVVHAILSDGTVGTGVSLLSDLWNVVRTDGVLYTDTSTSLTDRSVAGVSFAFTDLLDASGANLTNGTGIKGIMIGDTSAADFYDVYANVSVIPEPSVAMFGGSLAMLLLLRRRR